MRKLNAEEEDTLLNIHRAKMTETGGREFLLRKQELEIQHHNHAYWRPQRRQARNTLSKTFGTPNSLDQFTDDVLAAWLMFLPTSFIRSVRSITPAHSSHRRVDKKTNNFGDYYYYYEIVHTRK
jgi:hypothetical protein